MMDIYAVLNINKDLFKNFALASVGVKNSQTDKIFNSNLNQLSVIEERMRMDNEIHVNKVDLDAIIKKLIKDSSNGTTSEWSTRELRILSYNLSAFTDNEAAFAFCIELINSNWRNLFFNGIIHSLMNCWLQYRQEQRVLLCGLLTDKLCNYEGNNSKYNHLKDHTNFFEPQGPVRLWKLISQRGMNIFYAAKILGFSSKNISASYYSDTIINYYKDVDVDKFGELEELFRLHNVDRTKKLLFAYMIEKADAKGDLFIQDRVSKCANSILGDLSINATWAPFFGATKEEKILLAKVCALVKKWYAIKLIEVFFEVCVHDNRRKDFWFKYIDEIEDIKVAGSKYVHNKLLYDKRISELLGGKFIMTNSTVSLTSALILRVKRKIMVEFSDIGALYVYNNGDKEIEKVFGVCKRITSVNDLKRPYMSMLVEKVNSWYYGYEYQLNDVGKFDHRGWWEERLSKWVEEKIVKDDSLNSFLNDVPINPITEE